MSRQRLHVDPNLPMPVGVPTDHPHNPKSTIKHLMMAGAQANVDAQYDPVPNRDGFQSQFEYSNPVIYSLLLLFLLVCICNKNIVHWMLLGSVALVLIYLERNLKRIV